MDISIRVLILFPPISWVVWITLAYFPTCCMTRLLITINIKSFVKWYNIEFPSHFFFIVAPFSCVCRFQFVKPVPLFESCVTIQKQFGYIGFKMIVYIFVSGFCSKNKRINLIPSWVRWLSVVTNSAFV